jgi:hypothetical protein
MLGLLQPDIRCGEYTAAEIGDVARRGVDACFGQARGMAAGRCPGRSARLPPLGVRGRHDEN